MTVRSLDTITAEDIARQSSFLKIPKLAPEFQKIGELQGLDLIFGLSKAGLQGQDLELLQFSEHILFQTLVMVNDATGRLLDDVEAVLRVSRSGLETILDEYRMTPPRDGTEEYYIKKIKHVLQLSNKYYQKKVLLQNLNDSYRDMISEIVHKGLTPEMVDFNGKSERLKLYAINKITA